MNKYLLRVFPLLLTAVFAQAMLSAPRPAYAQEVSAESPEQLDQLLAPIALYPDPLLGEILMASTYPLEVAEAARWRDANPGISGDYLTAALEQQPWDPSVKGLTEFPDVLQMMNTNLEWTEQLGEAFLADQPGVMDTVQALRRQARASGALVSSRQQVISEQDGDILIAPADPAEVYVPYYNPTAVFSPWPWPGYMPYVFAAPPGVVYISSGFGYIPGVFIVDALWGWDRWDWHQHRIHVDGRRWRVLDNGQPPPGSGAWAYNPNHRHNIPYKNAAVRAHFETTSPEASRSYRGYEERSGYAAGAPVSAGGPHERGGLLAQHQGGAEAQPRVPSAETENRPVVTREETRQPERQHAPPMFESFAPQEQVRAEAARGNISAHPEAAHAPPAERSPEPARTSSPDEHDREDHR